MPITPPVVKAQMLIRKPAAEVFEAFADPSITTRFWFTKGSERLETGKTVKWEWEMYGVSSEVTVKEIDPNKRILVEWDDPPNFVEWEFTDRGDQTTLVVVKNWGFQGSDDEVVAKALDSMGGFSLVLAGCKAFLEHGIDPKLVLDHAPDAHKK